MIIGIDASRAFVDERTGTENYSYNVITHMLRLPESKNHQFVLFIRPNTKLPTELDGYGNLTVKVIPLKYLWTQIGLAWETWKYPRLDLLWIPAHTLPILRNPNIKTVVTIHGIEYKWLKEYKNSLQRWYLPLSTIYAAKNASGIIAVSNFTKNELQKEIHNNPKNIKVIHEGVELSSKSASQRISKSASQFYQKLHIVPKKYVLFVGSVQPRKNLVSLVQAYVQYAKKHPDHKLVIAGQFAWDYDEIVAAPKRYGISDKVVFTGRVSDAELNILYMGARLYVQPSITEGFGLPMFEAMAAKVPVVCSDGGALAEVVGEAGVIVPLNSEFVDKLAQTMLNVSVNESLRTKLIKLGGKRISEFGWADVAFKTLKYLKNIGSR